MNILLDTSTFIWIVSNPQRLSQTARDICLKEENALFLSVVSGWEMMVKYHLHKLPLPEKPEIIITSQAPRHNIQIIPLEMKEIFYLSMLPEVKNHRDPFDRMLICQSWAQKMPILTPDPWIRKYDVKVLW